MPKRDPGKRATLVRMRVNGRELELPRGQNLAAALFGLAQEDGEPPLFRRSRTGQARAALCGMGTCWECRVRIDGQGHQRACQLDCREGMEVEHG